MVPRAARWRQREVLSPEPPVVVRRPLSCVAGAIRRAVGAVLAVGQAGETVPEQAFPVLAAARQVALALAVAVAE
jgi:hypothetical protein